MEGPTIDAPTPTPAADSHSEAPAPAVGPPRRLLHLAAVAGLFGVGLLASWLTKEAPAPEPEGEPAIAVFHEEAPPKKTAPSAAPAVETLSVAAGDRYFRDERYDLARGVYRQLEEEKKPTTPSLSLRLALCDEELGAFDDALKRYQEVAPRGSFTQAQAAHLCQARVHLRRGKPAEARAMLWPFVLRGGHGGDPAVLAEAAQMLALSLGLEATQAAPAETELVFPRDLPWGLERFLDWPASAAEKKEPRQRLVLAPAANKLDQMVLESCLPKAPALEVVDAVVRAAGVSLDFAPEAAAALEARQMSLFSANLSVLSVLQGIADSFDLACKVEGEKVRFALPAAADREETLRYRRDLARRLLSETAAHYPKHVLAPAALLLLGNLEGAGRPSQALSWYERLDATAPAAKENLFAQYNRGVLSRREGDHAAAKRAFFAVVDQAPGHPLAGAALLRLGGVALEEGDYPKALTYLKRADGHVAESPERATFVLTLALAYALSDNADQTRLVLTKRRGRLHTESQRAYASFVIAYAKFRAGTSAEETAASGAELLVDLLSLPEETPLGDLGRYAVGLAYSDLGIWDRASRVFERIEVDAKGPLPQEARLRLADCRAALGRRKEARAIYELLAKGAAPASPWARFRLAVMALEDDQPRVCIDWCRRLLDEPTPLGRPRILMTMGQAYERLGDVARAIRCFAGELPD